MLQVLLLIGAVLALIASMATIYEKGGDAREMLVRNEYASKAETQRKADEAAQKMLRDWALQLSQNYLKFGRNQEVFFQGVKNDLATQIANDPNLRRACIDASRLPGFNGEAGAGGSGASAAPGALDGALPRKPAAPAR